MGRRESIGGEGRKGVGRSLGEEKGKVEVGRRGAEKEKRGERV